MRTVKRGGRLLGLGLERSTGAHFFDKRLVEDVLHLRTFLSLRSVPSGDVAQMQQRFISFILNPAGKEEVTEEDYG